jgi:SPX domain protein involved in polyphosphate accumulation
MKYQQHLKENISPDFGEGNYLAYGELDDIIRKLSTKAFATDTDTEKRTVSMSTNATVASGTSDAITDETFFRQMDAELAKVEEFTLTQVNKLREEIDVIEQTLKSSGDGRGSTDADRGKVQTMVDSVAGDFLELEKYVNLNFMGFHKILKKHDKYVPSNPCKAFYVSRMHGQAWVRGDYSDVVVRLSDIYSALRGDHTAEDKGGDSQSFLRQTSKYWIKTEDVSAVKYAVLKHLPVFLQKTS